jgi:hypothetical protein
MLVHCSCSGEFLQRRDVDLGEKGGHSICGEGSQPDKYFIPLDNTRWVSQLINFFSANMLVRRKGNQVTRFVEKG